MKNLTNYLYIDDIGNFFDISIKASNRYCDLVNNNLFTNFTDQDEDLQNKKINIFKYINFNKIIISVFMVSGGLIIIHYGIFLYSDLFFEYIQQLKDYLNPPHIPNKLLILVKPTQSFLFYKESDIPRINNFMAKRFEDYIKNLGISYNFEDFNMKKKKGYDLEEI